MTARLCILVACAACGGSSHAQPDASAGADGTTADATDLDAPAGCPDALFGTFVLPQLSSHSNVCVDSATCTFTRTAGCEAHFSCAYQGAGVQTGDVTFAPQNGALAATFVAGTRRHEWVYDGGMAYREYGSLADQHVCVFTTSATLPVFSRPAGDCPDLTRTYKLRQVTPHLCSQTLRCGVIQKADACTVDAFCTFPTGGSVSFTDVAVARSGTTGLVVGDATTDPMYPEHYDLRLSGDFVAGAGASTDIHVDDYFNSPTPTCMWMPNGPF